MARINLGEFCAPALGCPIINIEGKPGPGLLEGWGNPLRKLDLTQTLTLQLSLAGEALLNPGALSPAPVTSIHRAEAKQERAFPSEGGRMRTLVDYVKEATEVNVVATSMDNIIKTAMTTGLLKALLKESGEVTLTITQLEQASIGGKFRFEQAMLNGEKAFRFWYETT